MVAILFTSCKKDEVRPVPPAPPSAGVDYISLGEKEVLYGESPTVIDIDQDNVNDLIFSVWLVGDPIQQQDKRQFRIGSGINTSLAVNSNEQVPVMMKGANIPLSNFDGYSWFKVSSVILVQRIENINGDISWNGNWQGATKKYLSFQLIKNNQRFGGWVELSVDVVNEKLILHRLAISKEGEREINAG